MAALRHSNRQPLLAVESSVASRLSARRSVVTASQGADPPQGAGSTSNRSYSVFRPLQNLGARSPRPRAGSTRSPVRDRDRRARWSGQSARWRLPASRPWMRPAARRANLTDPDSRIMSTAPRPGAGLQHADRQPACDRARVRGQPRRHRRPALSADDRHARTIAESRWDHRRGRARARPPTPATGQKPAPPAPAPTD